MPKKLSLNQDELAIVRLLQSQHLGPDDCITNAKLAQAVGVEERACRYLVEHLRKTYGLPIVAIYGKGVFWARTKSEFWEHVDAMEKHALRILTSQARMKETARDIFSGNLEIDFEGAASGAPTKGVPKKP